MLGGSVAGTAVAWAVASGSASADEGLGALDLERHAADAVRVVEDTAKRVTGSLPGKQQAADALDAVRSHESLRLSQQPVSLPTGDAAGTATGVVDAVAGSSEPPAAVDLAAVENVATEVAATALRAVPAPDGTPTAASPRATSGVDGPQGGADGAPVAHSPASVPPVPSPAAAASGCAAGSSLFPALVGQHTFGDTTGRVLAVVVPTSECGRPDTTGSQPGTSPD